MTIRKTGRTPPRACRVTIQGRVTGVGFRCSCAMMAQDTPGIVGHVMNIDDNEVEVLLQGPPESVALMLEWLKEGPPTARVDRILVVDVEPNSSLTRFRILV